MSHTHVSTFITKEENKKEYVNSMVGGCETLIIKDLLLFYPINTT